MQAGKAERKSRAKPVRPRETVSIQTSFPAATERRHLTPIATRILTRRPGYRGANPGSSFFVGKPSCSTGLSVASPVHPLRRCDKRGSIQMHTHDSPERIISFHFSRLTVRQPGGTVGTPSTEIRSADNRRQFTEGNRVIPTAFMHEPTFNMPNSQFQHPGQPISTSKAANLGQAADLAGLSQTLTQGDSSNPDVHESAETANTHVSWRHSPPSRIAATAACDQSRANRRTAIYHGGFHLRNCGARNTTFGYFFHHGCCPVKTPNHRILASPHDLAALPPGPYNLRIALAGMRIKSAFSVQQRIHPRLLSFFPACPCPLFVHSPPAPVFRPWNKMSLSSGTRTKSTASL